ncbi:MAG: EscR/YscR/HrcR family type III secretion system export apparatus protein [Kofleriaceae bacterium]
MFDANSVALIAIAAIIPLVALMLTSFVKVSVVLSLLRNAIGANDAPSGLVVMGLSLVLTFFVMAPVAVEMVGAASVTPAAPAPPTDGEPVDIDAVVRQLVPAQYQAEVDAAQRSLGPLRGFLERNTAAADRTTFTELGRKLGHRSTGDELSVLAPAFLTTELREAFAIAVLVFIPFLVLDLVVGLGLAALGLQTTSPQLVALPLKLLLFVAVDGWRLLIDSLLRGYA